MGRAVAILLFLAASAAAVVAGLGLFRSLNAPPVASGIASQDVAGSAEESEIAEAGEEELVWLPLFGREEAAAPEPEAEAPEPPPSFDHDLKGVIVSGAIKWAIISANGSDQLVREGDVLNDARIVAIHPGGVDVEIDGETLSIGFSDRQPVEVAEIEVDVTDGDGAPKGNFQPGAMPRVQEVIYQDMTAEELKAILRKAEEERRARGWIVESED